MNVSRIAISKPDRLIKRKVIYALLASLLSACGGGGAGSSSSAPSPTVEGFWQGPSSTGYTVSLVVLEDGQTWGMYSSGNLIYGALFGSTTSSGGKLSGTGTDFYFPTSLAQTASFSGSYVAKSNLTVATSLGTTFTGAYSNIYDTPASLSAVAGAFAGYGRGATSGTYYLSMTVSSAGALSLTTPQCSSAGSLMPRSSGKGIFDYQLTFAGTSCPFRNVGTVSGVAHFDSVAKSIYLLGLNAYRTDGFFFVGSR